MAAEARAEERHQQQMAVFAALLDRLQPDELQQRKLAKMQETIDQLQAAIEGQRPPQARQQLLEHPSIPSRAGDG